MDRSGRTIVTTLAAIGCLGCFRHAEAGTEAWIDLTDETDERSIVANNLFKNDPDEVDYAWGDVDQDGDLDLVIARKEDFTSTGKRPNVFLMNEGIADGHALDGVLVDRTTEYASASDVPGDNGFLTPTNDRDIQLHDVNGDDWLDIITCTTLTDNQAKHLSHPRIYINLGEDGGGNWLGWEYQDARIPQMHPTAGPRFCSVAVGDVTGDGAPDLWYGDYDSGGFQIFDFNNRLLINDGNGFFSDQSSNRMTSQMLSSAFGAAGEIHDMNGDGVNDIVKQTSLASPTHIAVIYNNPSAEGFFNHYQVMNSSAPYFVEIGDLNNDGKLDAVRVDDGTDAAHFNMGNDGSGHVIWQTAQFLGTGGFGGNAIIDDLDNDGWNDVIITDVDVDIQGCGRTTFVRRNLGGTPGDIPNFQEEGGNVIPGSRNGVHDVAIFDINGDGWLDLVWGRCSGTEIYMNNPPAGLLFNYLNGVPQFIEPMTEKQLTAKVVPAGGVPPMPDTGKFFLSINGGAFQESDMQYQGNDVYTTTLPAHPCTTTYDYYFQADAQGGSHYTDPSDAPGNTFTTVAAFGTESDRNEFEDANDTSGWLVDNAAGENGGWERVDPNGTIFFGDNAAPENDATNGAENVKAYVTMNGPEGDTEAGLYDVDGGPHYLTSPAYDLTGSDATITFTRWFYSTSGVTDTFVTEISDDDGSNWVTVTEATSGASDSEWSNVNFVVSDYVTPSSAVRVRFTAADDPNDSVTELGVDNFEVTRLLCSEEVDCPTDTDGNGSTDVDDLVAVILAFGTDDPAADVNGSGLVDVDDLVAVILAFGACG